MGDAGGDCFRRLTALFGKAGDWKSAYRLENGRTIRLRTLWHRDGPFGKAARVALADDTAQIRFELLVLTDEESVSGLLYIDHNDERWDALDRHCFQRIVRDRLVDWLDEISQRSAV